jgi:hypothetical protein
MTKALRSILECLVKAASGVEVWNVDKEHGTILIITYKKTLARLKL